MPTARPGYAAPSDRTEAIMSAYQQMIQDQLEEGLRALQHTANQLMHEIASEVWRTAGGDKGEVQGKLLEALSRDQSIRSLIAHTDERFQTLAVRTARVEDTLNMVAEGIRSAKDQLARGVDALQDVQDSPAARGVADIRARLDEVTRQIAIALTTLAERDRAIVETVQQRVREHGELVSTETAAVTRAMESYVQQGVAVIGQLASDVETRMASIRTRDEEIGARISEAARTQLDLIDQRIEAISERLGGQTTTLNEAMAHLIATSDERNRSLGEYVELVHERVSMEGRDVLAAVETSTQEAAHAIEASTRETGRTIETSMQEIGRIIETSTQEIGRTIQATREEADRAIEDTRARTDLAIEGSARQINQAIEARIMGLAELVRSDSTALRNELVRTATAQDESLARALDERLGRVSESLATATDWMVDEIARRVGEESGLAIRTRLNEALVAIERQGDETTRALHGRLDDAVMAIDRNMIRMSDTLEGQLERLARTVGERASEAVARSQMRTEETVTQAVDARVASLAKMVRSDNESLARQIVADQEASKQALRAMKELQASLPADVIETVQRRMDDLAESVAKSQEMLAQRIDRMAAKVGERYDNDIQIVIDRMGDAMHALASLGKAPQTSEPERIELE